MDELYNKEPSVYTNEHLNSLAGLYTLNQLKVMLKELFLSKGIEKCAERWLETTEKFSKSEKEFKNAIYTRLYQGNYFNREYTIEASM